MSNRPRILLIDEEQSYAESLAHVLNRESIAQATAYSPLTDSLSGLNDENGVADLVVTNSEIGGRSVFELMRRRGLRNVGRRVAILSNLYSDFHLLRALNLGVRGYLLKTAPLDSVVAGIRRMLDGKSAFAEEIEPRLSWDVLTSSYKLRNPSFVARLNDIQLEVLRLTGEGYSTKEIADQLSTSPKSVESYRYRMMKALNVDNSLKLAILAMREGVVPRP